MPLLPRRLHAVTIVAALMAVGACSDSNREASVEVEVSATAGDQLVDRSFAVARQLVDLSTGLTLTSVPLFEDIGGFLTTAGMDHGESDQRLLRPQIDLARDYDILPDGMDATGGNQLTVQASAPMDGDRYCFLALRFSFPQQSRLARYEALTVETVSQAFDREADNMKMLDVGRDCCASR